MVRNSMSEEFMFGNGYEISSPSTCNCRFCISDAWAAQVRGPTCRSAVRCWLSVREVRLGCTTTQGCGRAMAHAGVTLGTRVERRR
jgi:hypothetical protein